MTLKVIEQFEEAVREHAFIGAQPPEDHAEIERMYEESKVALEAALRRKSARTSGSALRMETASPEIIKG